MESSGVRNEDFFCFFLDGAKGKLGCFFYALRIQVCPKKGIAPTFLFVSDGIGALNPTRSGRFWILRDESHGTKNMTKRGWLDF